MAQQLKYWMPYLKLAGAGLIGIAIGYLIGRIHGLSHEVIVRQELEAQQAQMEKLRGSQSALAQRIYALDARRQLSRARSAIEARNFGIAQGFIEAAQAGLRKSAPILGKHQEDIVEQSKALNALSQKPWTEHHQAITGILNRFDAALPIFKEGVAPDLKKGVAPQSAGR